MCRLTDVRYVDDMLLFAKSREELEKVMVSLVDRLRKIGLELNASKTKVITNDIHLEKVLWLELKKSMLLKPMGNISTLVYMYQEFLTSRYGSNVTSYPMRLAKVWKTFEYVD